MMHAFAYQPGSTFNPGPRRRLTRDQRRVFRARVEMRFRRGDLTRARRDAVLELARRLGRDGRLDPARATVAADARCSVRTVDRAKSDADRLGLLRWQRRLRRGADGWRCEQASNAYELVPDGRPVTPRPPAPRRGERRPAPAAAAPCVRCGGQPGALTREATLPCYAAPPEWAPDPVEARAALTEIAERRQAELVKRWREARTG